MADLRGQQLKDSYQNVITDSGSDLNGIQNGNGADITGRIVERDSNDDGEFVVFADNTMICSGLQTISERIDISEDNLFRSTGTASNRIDFPQTFTSISFAIATQENDSGVWVGRSRKITTSSFTPILLTSSSKGTSNRNIHFLAKGTKE